MQDAVRTVLTNPLTAASKSLQANGQAVTILVDGLDEIPAGGRRAQVLAVVAQLLELQLHCPLHLVVTSDAAEDIATAIYSAGDVVVIDGTGTRQREDLEFYARSRIVVHRSLAQLDGAAQEHFVQVLADAADGSFLTMAIIAEHLRAANESAAAAATAATAAPQVTAPALTAAEAEETVRAVVRTWQGAQAVVTWAWERFNAAASKDHQTRALLLQTVFEDVVSTLLASLAPLTTADIHALGSSSTTVKNTAVSPTGSSMDLSVRPHSRALVVKILSALQPILKRGSPNQPHEFRHAVLRRELQRSSGEGVAGERLMRGHGILAPRRLSPTRRGRYRGRPLWRG